MARTIAVKTPDVFRRYEIVLLIVLIIRHSSAIEFSFILQIMDRPHAKFVLLLSVS